MEPERKTAENLLAVQEALLRQEMIFHRPEPGMSRETLEAMTDDGFWETGASGKRYSREFVIDTVMQRCAKGYEDEWSTEDVYCQLVLPGHYLLTYTLHQGERVTRRTTLWRAEDSRWIAVYHQGTIVEGTG